MPEPSKWPPMRIAPAYPTPRHEQLARDLTNALALDPRVQTVLLSGSLARGRGVPESCVDLTVMVRPEDFKRYVAKSGDRSGAAARRRREAFTGLGADEIYEDGLGMTVIFSGLQCHLGFTDGDLKPGAGLPREDGFELEVGNYAVYSVPLLDRDSYWENWRRRFLPFLPEDVRLARLEAVRADFEYNLENIRLMARRGLLFHGLERVMIAFRYLIHMCFLTAKVYPIDYMKHLEEQVTLLLGHPGWLSQMSAVFTVPNLTPGLLMAKADLLRHLADSFLAELQLERR